VNIFTAQKLPEWDVEKSELVNDAILVALSLILWILLIISPHNQGPNLTFWSRLPPAFQIFAIYVLYPIFLVVIIKIFYSDIKTYKSR
jgi:hypothetical protein